jgi:hypothetical protein
MVNLTELVSTWVTIDGWSIAPEDQPHFPSGSRVKIGLNCKAGDGFTAGNRFKTGDHAKGIINLGITDGYYKSLSSVNGVMYVGAGCRWFTLDAAKEHWSTHDEDRGMTVCMLPAMYAIAKHLGLKTS